MRPALWCALSLVVVACQQGAQPAAAPVASPPIAPSAAVKPPAVASASPPAPGFAPLPSAADEPAPEPPAASPGALASAAPPASAVPPPADSAKVKPRPSPESRGFRLSTGLPKPKGPTTGVGMLMMKGQMPAELITRVIRQSFGRFRLCYEQGMRVAPELQGRVEVEFTIEPDGAVSGVADAGSNLPDPAVVSCVVKAFSMLSFPAPPRGKAVSVIYPISFAPGG
jgi:outer membrane biosynthesis protein TonB